MSFVKNSPKANIHLIIRINANTPNTTMPKEKDKKSDKAKDMKKTYQVALSHLIG